MLQMLNTFVSSIAVESGDHVRFIIFSDHAEFVDEQQKFLIWSLDEFKKAGSTGLFEKLGQKQKQSSK